MSTFDKLNQCRWCEKEFDLDDLFPAVDENKYLYHHKCFLEMEYEKRQEQFMKHAPDNMG